MKLLIPVFTLGVSLPALAAIDPNLDPLKVGNTVYRPSAEDNDVRVMEVNFAPGQKMAMHEHPKHFAYVVQGGKLTIHEQGKEPVTMELKAGQTVMMEGQKHEAQERGQDEGEAARDGAEGEVRVAVFNPGASGIIPGALLFSGDPPACSSASKFSSATKNASSSSRASESASCATPPR